MLTQGAPSPHEAILLVQSPTRAAVRMGEWKLLMNASEQNAEAAGQEAAGQGPAGKEQEARNIELYNLAADIGEKTNLAARESVRVLAMRAKLDELLKGAVRPGHLGRQ